MHCKFLKPQSEQEATSLWHSLQKCQRTQLLLPFCKSYGNVRSTWIVEVSSRAKSVQDVVVFQPAYTLCCYQLWTGSSINMNFNTHKNLEKTNKSSLSNTIQAIFVAPVWVCSPSSNDDEIPIPIRNVILQHQVVGALALSRAKGGSWRRWYLPRAKMTSIFEGRPGQNNGNFQAKQGLLFHLGDTGDTYSSFHNHGSGEWGPSSRRSFPSQFRHLSLNHDYGRKGGCWFQRCFLMFYPLEKIIQVDLCIVCFRWGRENQQLDTWIHPVRYWVEHRANVEFTLFGVCIQTNFKTFPNRGEVTPKNTWWTNQFIPPPSTIHPLPRSCLNPSSLVLGSLHPESLSLLRSFA